MDKGNLRGHDWRMTFLAGLHRGWTMTVGHTAFPASPWSQLERTQ